MADSESTVRDDDPPPTQSSVASEDFDEFRREMIERVESLFASFSSQVAEGRREQPAATADLSALNSILREAPKSEIRFRPFWKSAPAMWFSTLEEQFASRKIVSERDKYLKTICNLDEDIVRDLSSTISAASPRSRYKVLKDTLVRRFSISDSEKLRNIVGNVNMGSRTPSEFLDFLVSSGGSVLGREAILRIWRETIPANICVFLDSDINPQNEVENVRKADQIHASLKRDGERVPCYSVAAVDTRSKSDEMIRIESLEKKLDLVLDRMESRGGDRDFRSRRSSGNHRNNRDSRVPRPKHWLARPVNFGIKAANSLPIKVYGTKELKLKFSDDMHFNWTFLVADVPYCIFGGDMLKFFHLLPDLRSQALVDASGRVVCRGSTIRVDSLDIATLKLTIDPKSSPYSFLFSKYPDVTGLEPPRPISGSEVFHYIETEGIMGAYGALIEAVRGQREIAREPDWASDLLRTELCLEEFRASIEERIKKGLNSQNRKHLHDGVNVAATAVDFRLPALFYNGSPIKSFRLDNIRGHLRREQLERMITDAGIGDFTLSAIKYNVRYYQKDNKNYSIVSVKDIFKEKGDVLDSCITPTNPKDFIEGHKYFILWRDCGSECTPEDLCCTENLKPAYIISLGINEEDAEKNYENRPKRFKMSKITTSSESSQENIEKEELTSKRLPLQELVINNKSPKDIFMKENLPIRTNSINVSSNKSVENEQTILDSESDSVADNFNNEPVNRIESQTSNKARLAAAFPNNHLQREPLPDSNTSESNKTRELVAPSSIKFSLPNRSRSRHNSPSRISQASQNDVYNSPGSNEDNQEIRIRNEQQLDPLNINDRNHFANPMYNSPGGNDGNYENGKRDQPPLDPVYLNDGNHFANPMYNSPGGNDGNYENRNRDEPLLDPVYVNDGNHENGYGPVINPPRVNGDNYGHHENGHDPAFGIHDNDEIPERDRPLDPADPYGFLKHYHERTYARFVRNNCVFEPAYQEEREWYSRIGEEEKETYIGCGIKTDTSNCELAKKRTDTLFLRDIARFIWRKKLDNRALQLLNGQVELGGNRSPKQLVQPRLLEHYYRLYNDFLNTSPLYRNLSQYKKDEKLGEANSTLTDTMRDARRDTKLKMRTERH
ncbi:hypothetical protein TKK_0003016 [Trichogramma kaykai]